MGSQFWEWVIRALLLGGLVVIVVAARKWSRDVKKEEKNPLVDAPKGEDSSSAAPESGTNFSNGVRGGVGVTSRDRDAEGRKARERTGYCLYCDEKAIHPHPGIKVEMPSFTWLIRKLGGVPVWRFVLDRRPAPRMNARNHLQDPDSALCDLHYPPEISIVEKWLAENQADNADRLVHQQQAMVEFLSYGVHEAMEVAARRARSGRGNGGQSKLRGSTLKGQGAENVVSLPSPKRSAQQ